MTVEQMCRDLLEIAIRDGLVGKTKHFADADPQARTSCELVRMANKLAEFMAQRVINSGLWFRSAHEKARSVMLLGRLRSGFESCVLTESV